jgi:hypothetical protein
MNLPFDGSAKMVLDSETLMLIRELHDELCAELTAQRGVPPDESTKAALALRLVNCAATGELDREKLMAYARAPSH